MGANQKKTTSNVIAGIIMLAVSAILLIGDFIFFRNSLLKEAILLSPFIIFGVLLLFIKIKSYGWALGAIYSLLSFFGSLKENKIEGTILVAVLFVVCLGFFLYKNIKKPQQ